MSTTQTTTVCAKLEADELETLKAIESFERLRRSDIIRRAIRYYAQHLGVATDQTHTETPTP